ncbi:hypothetical protein DV738_g1219, partial [Chaetothyriales sp. CBS 135597]
MGFTYQLVIIGFLLSVMNLCNRRLAKTFFFASEVRWGSMALQNIDAILQQSMLVSRSSLLWRTAIFVLTALPIALSVAYKTFTGGHAGHVIHEYSAVQYGAFNKPMENNNIHLIAMVDAMTPMKKIADDDDNYPQDFDQPAIFGYNLAMLGDDEVVMIDMPDEAVLRTIQDSLDVDEYLYLSADIRGASARYNASIIRDDSLWDKSLTVTMSTRWGWRIAIARGHDGAYSHMWNVIGGYDQRFGSQGEVTFEMSAYANSNVFVGAFRNSSFAMGFNIYRLPCSVMWNITSTSIQLLSAQCDPEKAWIDETIVECNYDWVSDEKVLDAVDFAIAPFHDDERQDSPWKIPSAAMASATVWSGCWKHMMSAGDESEDPDTSVAIAEFRYQAENEKFELFHHVVRVTPRLYLIFAIQPIISVILFILNLSLYSTPISTNFGLITILASINASSLNLLSGAGLSGELKQRIFLSISMDESFSVTHMGESVGGKIQTELYTKDDSSMAKDNIAALAAVERGKKYM